MSPKPSLDNLDNLTDLSTEKMVLDASNPKRTLDKCIQLIDFRNEKKKVLDETKTIAG